MRAAALALALAGAAVLAPLPAAAGHCASIGATAVDAVESRDGGLMIPTLVGRHTGYLTLDTGSFANLLYDDVVRLEGLVPQPSGRVAIGASGGATDRVVLDRQRSYYVVPRGRGGDPREAGTLGTGWYAGSDLEIDFPARRIGLHAPGQCAGGSVPAARLLPISLDRHGRPFVTVVLDGQRLTALIDTGASESSMSLATAQRLFRLSPSDPGVVGAGAAIDATGAALALYRRQFGRLDVGGISFDKPWLDLSAQSWEPGADLILGMRQLGRMHLYFAFRERLLYASVQAGAADPPPATTEERSWPRCFASDPAAADAAIAGCSRIIVAGAVSKTLLAIAYSRRAAAYHRRAEDAKARHDFDAALDLEPRFAYALYGRGLVRQAAGDTEGGRADITAAQRLQPDIAQRFGR